MLKTKCNIAECLMKNPNQIWRERLKNKRKYISVTYILYFTLKNIYNYQVFLNNAEFL